MGVKKNALKVSKSQKANYNVLNSSKKKNRKIMLSQAAFSRFFSNFYTYILGLINTSSRDIAGAEK